MLWTTRLHLYRSCPDIFELSNVLTDGCMQLSNQMIYYADDHELVVRTIHSKQFPKFVLQTLQHAMSIVPGFPHLQDGLDVWNELFEQTLSR